MPAKRSHPKRDDRRTAPRCPACGNKAIKQETTVKGRAVAIVWRCTSCDERWRERRKTS